MSFIFILNGKSVTKVYYDRPGTITKRDSTWMYVTPKHTDTLTIYSLRKCVQGNKKQNVTDVSTNVPKLHTPQSAALGNVSLSCSTRYSMFPA